MAKRTREEINKRNYETAKARAEETDEWLEQPHVLRLRKAQKKLEGMTHNKRRIVGNDKRKNISDKELRVINAWKFVSARLSDEMSKQPEPKE